MNRKSASRLYFPGDIPAHGAFNLPAEQAHHVAHVLRLEPGAAIVVFDGRGFEYPATIERVSKSGVGVRVAEGGLVDRESPLAVTLAQGISSGERMDYTVQKAVELGVHALQPLATERSVVKLNPERAVKRVAHWQAIAVAACEQCGRNRVPAVLSVVPFSSWLGGLAADARRLMLAPGSARTLREIGRPSGPILLLVGPEGGLAPREYTDAQAAGFQPLRLGPRILRTETAAAAALAAMQTLWGDF